MRIHLLGFAFLARSVECFQPQTSHRRDIRIEASLKPVLASLAGLALAGQVAVASPLPVVDSPAYVVQERVVAQPVVASSTLLTSASFETMDFSMPSYEEGAKSSVTEAPSFGNPFADLKLPSLGGSDVSVDKTADKAAAKAAKEAEQKAKEEQKAVKEAEKEARRQEQLQKQKEAVARSAKVKEGEAANLSPPATLTDELKNPETPELKLPDIPDVKLPDMPKVDLPSLDLPKLDMPKLDMPKFGLPKMEVPRFEVPDVQLPSAPSLDIQAPDALKDLKLPELPKVSLPKLSLPSVPSFDSAPSFPSYDTSTAPSFGEDSGVASEFDSQEVRDQRAREARSVFKQADNEAKAIEAQARELRKIANDKKKIANAAKDEACKTRWGGKFLCFRPFNSGY